MMKSCNKISGDIDNKKAMEKIRRNQMKALCFKLASLSTPKTTAINTKHSSNKGICRQTEQFDNAAEYIQELRKRIDDLQIKKREMIHSGKRGINISTSSSSSSSYSSSSSSTCTMTGSNLSGPSLPILEVTDFETAIIVFVVTGLNKKLMLSEIIAALEENGAQVVNASYATVNDKIYHTIQSQVRCCRIGVDTVSVCDRLKKLVYA